LKSFVDLFDTEARSLIGGGRRHQSSWTLVRSMQLDKDFYLVAFSASALALQKH